jgi:hypothetical protein
MSERYWEPSTPPEKALKDWASQEVQDAVAEAVGEGTLCLDDEGGVLSVEFISPFYLPKKEGRLPDLYAIKSELAKVADEWIEECDNDMPDLCISDRRALERRAKLLEDLAKQVRRKVDRILSTKGTVADSAG